MQKLYSVVHHYKGQMSSQVQQVEQVLRKHHRDTLNSIQPVLDKFYQSVSDARSNLEGQALTIWLYAQQKLQQLQEFVLTKLDAFSNFAQNRIQQLQNKSTSLGVQAGIQQLEAAKPQSIIHAVAVPSAKIVDYLGMFARKYAPLVSLFAGIGQEAVSKIKSLILTVIMLNQPIQALAVAIDNTLHTPLYRVLTIACTEAFRTYRFAINEVYQSNSTKLKGWIWIAKLSPKTCAACIAMHGSIHLLNEHMNSHVNCQCVPFPVWWNVTSEPTQSGEDWLRDQSIVTQEAVLGSKYTAWKQRKFLLKDVIGTTYNPAWGSSIYEKSLKQLVGSR